MGKQINPNFKPLNKLERATISKLRNEYRNALKEIRNELSKLDEKGLLTPQELNKYKRQQALEYRIMSLLDGTYKNNFKEIKKGLEEQFQESFYLTAYTLDKNIDTKLDFQLLKKEVIENAIQNQIAGTNVGGKKWELNLRAGEKRNAVVNKINTEIVQGLRRGEGYASIAKVVKDELDKDFKRAVRIVNTETHRVQELGRYQATERAQELGVRMVKVWVSTLDSSTRDAHQDLDGQRVAMDEDFVSDAGGKGPFPGSMNNPADDIRCRCTFITEVEGFENNSRAERNAKGYTSEISNMSYKDWKKSIK